MDDLGLVITASCSHRGGGGCVGRGKEVVGLEGIELSCVAGPPKVLNWKSKSRSLPHFLHMQLRSFVGEKFIQDRGHEPNFRLRVVCIRCAPCQGVSGTYQNCMTSYDVTQRTCFASVYMKGKLYLGCLQVFDFPVVGQIRWNTLTQ